MIDIPFLLYMDAKRKREKKRNRRSFSKEKKKKKKRKEWNHPTISSIETKIREIVGLE